MYQGGPEAVKRQRTENYSRMMSDGTDDAGCMPAALDNNAEHFVRMMHGLHKLKKERVLCDVTLIAEGLGFSVPSLVEPHNWDKFSDTLTCINFLMHWCFSGSYVLCKNDENDVTIIKQLSSFTNCFVSRMLISDH